EICSCPSTVTGVGAVKPDRAIREPVTTIWSSAAASADSASGASGVVASWAAAGRAAASAAAITAPLAPTRARPRRRVWKCRLLIEYLPWCGSSPAPLQSPIGFTRPLPVGSLICQETGLRRHGAVRRTLAGDAFGRQKGGGGTMLDTTTEVAALANLPRIW